MRPMQSSGAAGLLSDNRFITSFWKVTGFFRMTREDVSDSECRYFLRFPPPPPRQGFSV